VKYLLKRFTIDILFDKRIRNNTFLALANLLKDEEKERIGAKIKFDFCQVELDFILIKGQGKIRSIKVENDSIKISVKGKIITRKITPKEEVFEAEECEILMSLKEEGGESPYVKPLIKDKDISIYVRNGEIEIED